MIHNNMMERPKCANPNCENKAFAAIGAEFYCVECLLKFKQAQQKYIQGVMNNDSNLS
jgi:late competence protein required for DNA uptake (superfamily II DNA/RNA helicase)